MKTNTSSNVRHQDKTKSKITTDSSNSVKFTPKDTKKTLTNATKTTQKRTTNTSQGRRTSTNTRNIKNPNIDSSKHNVAKSPAKFSTAKKKIEKISKIKPQSKKDEEDLKSYDSENEKEIDIENKSLKFLDSFMSNVKNEENEQSDQKMNKEQTLELNRNDYDYDYNMNEANKNKIYNLKEIKKTIKEDLTGNIESNNYNLNEKLTEVSAISDINIDLENNDNYSISSDTKREKFLKQVELIKKLLRCRNFQNFIKKKLKLKKIGIGSDGKLIKWSIFKKEYYTKPFLDYYYHHRIPYIIMRPRLDVIKRKREAQKKIKEKEKEKQKHIINTEYKENTNIKNPESTSFASILDKSVQNELEKSGCIIGEDNNTIIIQKRESLFPSQNNQKGFSLTKIPQKAPDSNENNIRLNIAFNKAKDAARVVRRLEYSYSMRVNIMLSKPIFQKNAKIIQNWWRSIKFIKSNTPKLIKIQAYMRGMLIRKAFKDVCNLYKKQLPFIEAIDKIFSRRSAKFFFDKIIPRYGLLNIINLAKVENQKIIDALKRHYKKQEINKKNNIIFIWIKKKCCYTKDIFDWETKQKILQLQAFLKYFLMHKSERILKILASKYNPNLYYYLKYGKNPELLKKKLQKFRDVFLKMKELKVKATNKFANIDNKFDYLKLVLRKKVFNDVLKKNYHESLNNKDEKYQKKIKLKILLNRENNSNKTRLLKKFLLIWNIKANYLKEYVLQLKNDRLLLLEAIIRYHKKYEEKVFMLLLNTISENKKNTQYQSLNKVMNIYDKYNGVTHNNNNLLRIMKKWKKNTAYAKFENAAGKIIRNAKKHLILSHAKKDNALLKCFNIRNKIFKEKFDLWRFNSRKLKNHFCNFTQKTLKIINMRKKLKSLKKNLESLERRKKNYLKKYFDRFKTNTGVRKLLYINLQLCLFDENHEVVMNDKYSLMKYIKDMPANSLKNQINLKNIFDFWKTKQKITEFKKLVGQRLKIKCESKPNILKLKFIHWFKNVQLLKFEQAAWLIQRKYHTYKRQKNKK